MTLLHMSARNGSLEILEFLMVKGLNINSADKLGNTPLHYAVHNDYLLCINLLVEKNAKDNILNKQD